MKKLILSIAMITFIAGTISVSFGQDVNKQSDKALKTMQMDKNIGLMHQQDMAGQQLDSVADFQKLSEASELRFVENEKSLADLKLKNTTLDTLKNSAKSKEIDLLENQNNFLRKQLNAYKKEGKTEWKAFKKQYNSDMDKLTEDLKNMKNEATM